MEVLLIIGGIVAILILVWLVYKLVITRIQVVPQEERLVIYRLGRFHRMAGPGLVWIKPRLEEIKRVLEVRDHPIEITVSGLFAFGVPNDLTLNLWCSFDLEKAAGDDRDRLARFVQMRDSERHQQVEVKMRESLVNRIADLQKRMPLPEKPKAMDGVIALAPGRERYNILLKELKKDLEKALPTVGVVLNTDHDIVLTRRGISDEIVEAIKRRRGRQMDSEWLTEYAEEVRRRFPDISNAVLAQMLASIEGVDVGRVQRLLLEQEAGTEAEVEFEMSGDGTDAPNVITKPRRTPSRPQPQPPEKEAPFPELTERDLSVLKRVPRRDQEQQQTA